MEYMIVQLDRTNTHYLPHSQQAFDVIGRFIPIYDGVNWSYKEVYRDENRKKTYPDESFDPFDYIDNNEQTIFLAIYNNNCVGSIRLSTCWFGNGYIEDFAIDPEFRKMGIGKNLMDRAVNWCKEKDFSGIALETQDNNLQACRFYSKYGFKLCGINTQKYSLTEFKDETCLYFYMKL